MAFTVEPPDIASKLAKKCKMILIFMCPIVVASPSVVITGVSHQDVLLPCHGSYRSAFRFYDLVVNWQLTENDHVVHSFFDGTDQPQYQEKEFKGRTRLFPEEFQKGNASLLLKNLRASDAGRYTCHCILDDDQVHNELCIELQVQEDEIYNSDKDNNILLYVLIPVGLLLLIICAIILVIIKKRRKAKPEVDITSQGLEEAEHTRKTVSSEAGVCLLSQENGTSLRELAEVELTEMWSSSSESEIFWVSEDYGNPLRGLSRSAGFESGVCWLSGEHVGNPLRGLPEVALIKTRAASFQSGVHWPSGEHAGYADSYRSYKKVEVSTALYDLMYSQN